MTADNKPQQIKRENVKKMLALKTDNAFGNLLTKVRQTKRGIDEMWQSVRRIEQEQDEILRKEDEEYALQKETERQF